MYITAAMATASVSLRRTITENDILKEWQEIMGELEWEIKAAMNELKIFSGDHDAQKLAAVAKWLEEFESSLRESKEMAGAAVDDDDDDDDDDGDDIDIDNDSEENERGICGCTYFYHFNTFALLRARFVLFNRTWNKSSPEWLRATLAEVLEAHEPSEMLEALKASEASNASDASDASEASEATRASLASEAKKASEASEATRALKVLEVTKASVASEASEAWEGSITLEASIVLEASKVLEASEVTEVSLASEALKASDASVVLEASVASGALVALEASEALKTSVALEASKASFASKASKTLEAPEAAEAAKPLEASKSSEALMQRLEERFNNFESKLVIVDGFLLHVELICITSNVCRSGCHQNPHKDHVSGEKKAAFEEIANGINDFKTECDKMSAFLESLDESPGRSYVLPKVTILTRF